MNTQLLTLTFPKRVGGSAVRADVSDLIHRVIGAVAADLDLSENTLEVHFTNDRNLHKPAHLMTSMKVLHDERQGGYVNIEAVSTLGVGFDGAHPQMKINLQGVKAADYDGLTAYTANHIIHETLHYLQTALGVMSSTQTIKGYGRRVNRRTTTTWNHGPAFALNHAIRTAAGRNMMSEPQESDEVTTLDRASLTYGQMRWEHQAWRGAYILGRALGFPPCSKVTETYRAFLKRKTV